MNKLYRPGSEQRLLDGQLGASVRDDFLRRRGLKKLEPVAESVSLADQSMDLDIAWRQ
jgi:hypothetical protein